MTSKTLNVKFGVSEQYVYLIMIIFTFLNVILEFILFLNSLIGTGKGRLITVTLNVKIGVSVQYL